MLEHAVLDTALVGRHVARSISRIPLDSQASWPHPACMFIRRTAAGAPPDSGRHDEARGKLRAVSRLPIRRHGEPARQPGRRQNSRAAARAGESRHPPVVHRARDGGTGPSGPALARRIRSRHASWRIIAGPHDPTAPDQVHLTQNNSVCTHRVRISGSGANLLASVSLTPDRRTHVFSAADCQSGSIRAGSCPSSICARDRVSMLQP